jgi:UDP-N-acetylmuramoyl-tripeptide--D-alanyl-D-alanine ligase
MGIFINNDNPLLKQMALKSGLIEDKQIPYALNSHPDLSMVTGKITACEPLLSMDCQTGSSFQVNTRMIGTYNAENVLAAVTIGHFFGLKNNQIKQGIESYEPQNNRSQLTITEKNKLIVDAYNANPTSMQAAILNFDQMDVDAKLLILGDMLELGSESLSEHQKIIRLLEEKGFKEVVLVGKEFHKTVHAFRNFADVSELSDYLTSKNIVNQYILIKGSRGIQLEKIIPLL